jgi:protein-S-isoprenylcysteine O-methyltransferase Ste14
MEGCCMMYLLWGLVVVLMVTGLWTYALIALALLLPVLFGSMVIGVILHDEEEYLNRKFGTQDEQKEKDNGK